MQHSLMWKKDAKLCPTDALKIHLKCTNYSQMPSPLSFHWLMQQGCERRLSHTAATSPFSEISSSLLAYPWTTCTHTSSYRRCKSCWRSVHYSSKWVDAISAVTPASPKQSSCRGSSAFPPTTGAGLLLYLVLSLPWFQSLCSVWVNLSSSTPPHCQPVTWRTCLLMEVCVCYISILKK